MVAVFWDNKIELLNYKAGPAFLRISRYGTNILFLTGILGLPENNN